MKQQVPCWIYDFKILSEFKQKNIYTLERSWMFASQKYFHFLYACLWQFSCWNSKRRHGKFFATLFINSCTHSRNSSSFMLVFCCCSLLTTKPKAQAKRYVYEVKWMNGISCAFGFSVWTFCGILLLWHVS